MLYDYFQANFTNPISLNDSMKVAPGTYVCVDGCCNRWPITSSGSALPDSPSGLIAVNRYTNDCTTANCIDTENVPIIDNAINAGLPMHIRVHCVGCEYNSHSVVLIGHVGSDYYIRDPWALDDQTRTLTSGALGQYVVDFIDVSTGTPPTGNCSYNSNQIVFYTDANYGGQCVTKDIGDYPNPSSIGLSNDSISSIKVGSDVQAILCKDDNYLGGCETFTGDDFDLSNNSIGNDQVSSAKVQSEIVSTETRLYDNTNYGGAYAYVPSTGLYTVVDVFNDMAELIIMPSGWSVRLFEHNDYYGPQVCIQGNDANLWDNYYNDGNVAANSATWFEVYNQSSCPSIVIPPSVPALVSPTNGSTYSSTTSITLDWNSSEGATEYYAHLWGGPSIDINSGWVASTEWFIGTLWPGVYSWQVKARNSSGESSFSDTWIFTIAIAPPGAFNKISPANGATGQSTSPTLTWGVSQGATSYEYCYDMSDDDACSNWINVGTATSVSLSGLLEETTYYWHVRANNSAQVTYADGSATAFWSFTTGDFFVQTYLPVVRK